MRPVFDLWRHLADLRAPRKLGHGKCCGTDNTKFITQHRWLDSIHVGLPFPIKFATSALPGGETQFPSIADVLYLLFSLTIIILVNNIVLLAEVM